MNKRQIFTRIFLFTAAFILWGFSMSSAIAQDTTRRHTLAPVVVSEGRKPSVALSQVPVQVIDAERIERSGNILLSDAVRQMAGITLKDYGGIGGMKTMSARGLGSQFSTLTIDGVTVNDCQNGQVDLGRYLVGNSAFISFSNGQQDEALLSARAIAAGNVINMETCRPFFLPGEHTHIRIGMETGSFGMFSPTLSFEQRLSKKLSMTFWGNYLRSRGDYPFTLYYTVSQHDSSSVERRQNSQMWLATGDMNLFYSIAPNRTMTAKVHYVQGFHALPGPVIYYAVKGSEDTEEQLFFSQVKYRADLSKISYQLIAKYQYSSDLYEDFNAPTLSHYLCNKYNQQETYLSGAILFSPLKGFSLSLSSDAAYTALESNLAKNNEVSRTTALEALALSYKNNRISIKGNILATIINEHASDIANTITYRKLSPYLGFSVKPLRTSPIRLRYFFKETYRVPNFNEMYYFTISRDLKPERANQHNIGIAIPLTEILHGDSTQSSNISFSFTLDGYYNRVTDKIIAVPTQNMFLWSMMNLGLVEITGSDFQGNFEWQHKNITLSGSLTYTFQQALDRTTPGSKTYGHQIPYTPRHSGAVSLYLKTNWINMAYNCLIVGERFSKQQNNDNSRMSPYTDQGIALDRVFELPIGDLRIQAQVNNLFNVQYEVVRSYPMMGRNFRIKAVYSF
ncbi:MAG: TonB-dependent receptor [Bacteroidales bacterium]|nr:TonB-dependent receptor [Bacteroidales bacterium]